MVERYYNSPAYILYQLTGAGASPGRLIELAQDSGLDPSVLNALLEGAWMFNPERAPKIDKQVAERLATGLVKHLAAYLLDLQCRYDCRLNWKASAGDAVAASNDCGCQDEYLELLRHG